VLRAIAGYGLALWIGATLVLSASARLRRRSLSARLHGHVVPAVGTSHELEGLAKRHGPQHGPLATLVDSFEPVAAWLARHCGIAEPPGRRLARLGLGSDTTRFRLSQLSGGLGTLIAGAALAATVGLGPFGSVLAMAGGPVIAVLVLESRLSTRSRRWQRQVERELPVIAEQMAMLVSAGYSTGAALSRLATRGRGVVPRSLVTIGARVNQGLSESDALTEWASLADVDAAHRLARVLARGAETPDLGRLLSAEARAIRRELARRSVADAERRNQAVWIPVTVAALVPGVIFLAVPFLNALRAFAAP